MSKGPSGIFDGTRGNGQGKLELGSGSNTFPSNRSQISHIFGNREGHLPDTPANRRLIGDLANDSGCLLGSDMWGKEWYARINPDGTQVWATVLNGIIQNCGENAEPRPWNPGTGLSDSEQKRNGFRRRRTDQ